MKTKRPVIQPKIVRKRGAYSKPPATELQVIQRKYSWLANFRLHPVSPDSDLLLSAYSNLLVERYNTTVRELKESLQRDKDRQMQAILAKRKMGVDASDT